MRSNRIHQILSSLISGALIAGSLSLADVARASTDGAGLAGLRLPADWGAVTDSFQPTAARRVILIQDLHLHYPTQKRILNILNHLESRHLLNGPIAIEGTQGDFDLTPLAAAPAGKAKQEAVDYFMRKAELSGHEAFAILRGEGHRLYGVDDENRYQFNRELYRATLANRKALASQIAGVASQVAVLKKDHYSWTLRRLDKRPIYDVASAEALLAEKQAAAAKIKEPAKRTLVQNLIEIDHCVYFLGKLLRQEATEEEVHYIAPRLSQFAGLTERLLKMEKVPSVDAAQLEETLKGGVDFYAVALMRDNPLAQNTLHLLGSNSTVALIAGGFHTAGITRELKKAGVGYLVITPAIDDVNDQYQPLYERRMAGEHVTLAEVARDLHADAAAANSARSGQMVALVTSLGSSLRGIWDFAMQAKGTDRVNTPTRWRPSVRPVPRMPAAPRPAGTIKKLFAAGRTWVFDHPVLSLAAGGLILAGAYYVSPLLLTGAAAGLFGVTLYSGAPEPQTAMDFSTAFPDDTHPILKRLISVRDKEIIAPGRPVSAEEAAIINAIEPELLMAHARAAFEGWRFSAVNFRIGKFSEMMAANMLRHSLNMAPFVTVTETSTGAREHAVSTFGKYGIPKLLGLDQEPQVGAAQDPLDVNHSHEVRDYMASASIGSYAIGALYDLAHKSWEPRVIPDQSYIFGLLGPKSHDGPGLDVTLHPHHWLDENMQRVADIRHKRLKQLRVTGLPIRERHFDLINNTLRVLGITMQDLPESVRFFFKTIRVASNVSPHDSGRHFRNGSASGAEYVQIERMEDIQPLRVLVEMEFGGILKLQNSDRGFVELLTDGHPMSTATRIAYGANEKSEHYAEGVDMAYGAGSAAGWMFQTRAAYEDIDFQGIVLSYRATRDRTPEDRHSKNRKDHMTLQVLDPAARLFGDCERQVFSRAGLIPESHNRVETVFDLEALTGGANNITVAVASKGNSRAHEHDFVPGLHEVEVINGGREVRMTGFVGEPSGRRRLVEMTFATGLAELEDRLPEADYAERIEILRKIGRLYGQLRMYGEAERAFAAAEHESGIPDTSGYAAYFAGMKELLTSPRPNTDYARHQFLDAYNDGRGHFPGKVMSEVVDEGMPITAEPSEMVDRMDNLAKASEQGRVNAIKILMTHFRGARLDEISNLRFMLLKLTHFARTHQGNGRLTEFADHTEKAIEGNPILRGSLNREISALTKVVAGLTAGAFYLAGSNGFGLTPGAGFAQSHGSVELVLLGVAALAAVAVINAQSIGRGFRRLAEGYRGWRANRLKAELLKPQLDTEPVGRDLNRLVPPSNRPAGVTRRLLAKFFPDATARALASDQLQNAGNRLMSIAA